MKDFIQSITENSLVYGLICICVSVIIVSILVDKKLKDTRSFSEHSAASWKGLIGSWFLAIIIFIKGFFLIIN